MWGMMNKIAMTTAIVASMGAATALGVALGDTINNDAQASIAPATNKVQESAEVSYRPPYTECGEPVQVGVRSDGMPRKTIDLCDDEGNVVQTVIYSGM